VKSEKETRVSEKLNHYRDDVMTHLKYIKERVDANHRHLENVNGRLRDAENSITGIKATGSTFTLIIGAILTWLGYHK
jgi:hypothetical protein